MIGEETQKKSNEADGATEAVLLPPDVVERLVCVEHAPTRYFAAMILAKSLESDAPVPVHSKIVCRILGDRHYGGYLKVMASFGDVVTRITNYMPKKLARKKQPQCMSWQRLRCQNIQHACEVGLPPSFLARFRSSFDWYRRVYLRSLDPGSAEASDLVGGFLDLLEVPEVSEQEAEAICDTPEAAADLVEKCERLREEGCSAHVGFDRGDRLY
ncbi:MAG: hypothetical protein KY475_15050, partial [Planctomycetes bacterium]|nr:hypothetical protein [Planctomycetota bacterium]